MSDPNASIVTDNYLVDDLRGLVANRELLVIVGTGVTVGATDNAPVASWSGLLKHGIFRSVELGRADAAWASRMEASLASGNLDELLFVAQQVSTKLGAPTHGEFRNWLRETIGDLRVQQPDVLRAIADLGVPIATTNYDGLIEEVTGLNAVTWRETGEVERVLRAKSDGILHLHGYWKDPESVVLGIRSYDQVMGHAHVQAVLRSLRMTHSFLFVGFGAGLNDPNFSAFLQWTRETFEESGFRQYRLARTNEVEELQLIHPASERLFVVPYGEKHTDLAPFVQRLIPVPAKCMTRPHKDEAVNLRPANQPVWNIPHDRNLDFTGRAGLLEDLASSLQAGQETALVQAQTMMRAIHGLGGIGKTQLAVEYAYRHAGEYDIVWWIRAEELATLTTDLGALSQELNLSDVKGEDQAATVTAVIRWLESGARRWLLIFDNVNDAGDVQGYIPKQGGHVLISSRSREWPRSVHRVEVNVLEPQEAIQFLLDLTGLDDHPAAAALAEELGYLPLALAQAGAYIDEVGLSLSGYLARFREHREELLQRGKPDDYPLTVATTWELSFQLAATRVPAAADLMNLLAFLAPEVIPRDLLAEHSQKLPESFAATMANPVALDEAIAALRHFSLLQVVNDQTLAVHRLVQFVARERLSEEIRRTWILAVIRTLNAGFPDQADDPSTWSIAARLLSHGLAAASFADEMGVVEPVVGQLLNRVGRYLAERALYVQARYALDRALEIHERTLGSEHPDVAVVLSDLAALLRAQGDLKGARTLAERSLAIRERVLGPDHNDVATALNVLALVLQDQGDLKGARPLLERSLVIREKALDPDHPDVATSLNNLALVLQAQGDLKGARPLAERSLVICEKALDPDHPDVGTALNSLASVLKDQGDLKGARPLLERSLVIREKALGPDHPDVSTALNNLALVLQDQGDLKGARPLFERSLAIQENVLGPDHPDVATSLNNLASVLRAQGDLKGAEPLFERSLAIQENVLGPDHPDVAKTLVNFGEMLKARGDFIRARQVLRRAVKILNGTGLKQELMTARNLLAPIDRSERRPRRRR